jgi:hypothetical protein
MADEPPRRSKVYVELGTPSQPVLVRWTNWGGRYRGGYDSYVLFTTEGPVLIDPEQPDETGAAELLRIHPGPPRAVVLTNNQHERSAYRIRESTGAPVWAPKSGEQDLEGTPDHLYADGDALPGRLRAIDISGRFSGDSVLWWPAPTGERVLFTGDTLCGAVSPDNPENAGHPRRAAGLYLGAGPFYLKLEHPDRLKASLRRVLDEDFDLICGAHGVPVRNARPALAHLLDLDWDPLLPAGQHPFVPA